MSVVKRAIDISSEPKKVGSSKSSPVGKNDSSEKKKTMEAVQEGNGKPVAGDDEEPMVGPGPAPRARAKRPLQFEQAYLDALPSANMYQFIFQFSVFVRFLGFSVLAFGEQ